MKLALLQEKQNRLYDFFCGETLRFDEVHALQNQMIEQNFFLMEEASTNAEFLVTSEAINFPGPPEWLDFSPWELLVGEYDVLNRRLSQFAADKGIWLAAGVYRPLPDRTMRNSLLIINRQGETILTYDKIHLAGSEKKNLIPGNTFGCFDSEFGKIGLCICWDMQFPEVCRILALGGAALVICPTWGWEAIYANARAYENGIHVAGAMAVPFNGPIQGLRTPSSIIDPEGGILAMAGAESAEILYCDIDLHREWDIHRIRMEDRRPELYQPIRGVI
ncbi:hypothetical protein FACS189485_00160 [Spirochaetia bacterium]|nr:hypothetical protein FACS189485_00160 [Spirochaetia bacterium]